MIAYEEGILRQDLARNLLGQNAALNVILLANIILDQPTGRETLHGPPKIVPHTFGMSWCSLSDSSLAFSSLTRSLCVLRANRATLSAS